LELYSTLNFVSLNVLKFPLPVVKQSMCAIGIDWWYQKQTFNLFHHNHSLYFPPEHYIS